MTALPIKTTVTVQPDAAAGIDGYMANGVYAAQSFGNANTMTIGTVFTAGTSIFNRALVKLSLATLGRRPRINNAVLTLTGLGGQLDSGDATVRCFLVTGTGVTEAFTWNTRDGAVAWSTAGGDYSLTPVAEWTGGIGAPLVFTTAPLFEYLVERGLSDGVFLFVGPETPGVSNYLTVYSSDDATAAHRPKAVVTFTKRPVLELLARQIADRLAKIRQVNGYSFDATVERPERLGANYRPVDGMVLVTQDGNVPNEEESPLGLDNRILDLQEDFAIVAFGITSDQSGDSVDELINQRAAECHAAVMVPESGSDWTTFNGLAWEAAWDTPEQYLDKNGQPLGQILHLLVKYRHPANDPFTPAL